jgi:hypothetical protein
VNKVLTVVSAILVGYGPRKELSFYSSITSNSGDLVWVKVSNSVRLALVVKTSSARSLRMVIKNNPYKLGQVHSKVNINLGVLLLAHLRDFANFDGIFIGEFINLVLPRFSSRHKFPVGLCLEPVGSLLKQSNITYLSQPYEDRRASYLRIYNAEIKGTSGNLLIIVPNKETATDLASHFLKSGVTAVVLGYGKEIVQSISASGVIICHPSYVLLYIGRSRVCIVERHLSTYGSNILTSFNYKSYLLNLISVFGIKAYYGDVSPPIYLDKQVPVLPSSRIDVRYGDRKDLAKAVDSIIVQALSTPGNILLVTPNNELGRMLICNDCKTILSCNKCQFPLSLAVTRQKQRYYNCGRCSEKYPIKSRCSRCEGWNIKIHSEGKQTYLAKYSKTSSLYKKRIKIIAPEGIANIQDNFTTSILIQPDYLLGSRNYRSLEILITELLTIRSFTKEKMFLLSCLKDNTILNQIRDNKLGEVIDGDKALRKRFTYPPFGTIVKIVEQMRDPAKSMVREVLQLNSPHITYKDYLSHTTGKKGTTYTAIMKFDQNKWPDVHLLASVLNLGPSVNVEVNPSKLI